MKRILVPLLIAVLVAAPAAASAAPGGGKGGGKPTGTSTIEVVLVDPTDTVVEHGDTVTFRVTTTLTDRPMVSLVCRQAGTVVYSAQAGFYDGYPWSKEFVLRSAAWSSGAASCDARLYMSRDGNRTTTLATTSFSVAA
jgi:hypothetical protein